MDEATPTNDDMSNDLSADLAALEALRQSVQKNLTLRPLKREASNPRLVPSSRHSLELPHAPLSPGTPASAYFTPIGIHDAFPGESPVTRSSPHTSRAIDSETLYGRLLSRRRPLLIDTRPPASHAAFQILHSINIAIPSLLLKRILSSKENAVHSIASLRQFITTNASRASWDKLMRVNTDTWDGDVILYDDEPGSTSAKALIPVIEPLLLGDGSVDWLEGGISVASRHPGLQTLVVSGDEAEIAIASAGPVDDGFNQPGLYALDTQFRQHDAPDIGIISASTSGGFDSSSTPSRTPYTAATPLMPGAMPRSGQGWRSAGGNDSRFADESPPPPVPGHPYNLVDDTPSPSPSQAAKRPPPRKTSLQNLKKLDTLASPLSSKKSKDKFGGLKLDLNLDETEDRTKPLSTTLGINTNFRLPQDDDDITAASPGPMLRSADAVRAKKSLDRLPKLHIAMGGPAPPLPNGGVVGGGGLAPPVPKKRSRSPSPGRLNLKHSNFNTSGASGSSRKPKGLVLDAGSPPPLTPRADLPPSPPTARPETSTFPKSPMGAPPPLPTGGGWPSGGGSSQSGGRSSESRFGRHHATSSISSNASGSSTHEEDPLPEFLISMVLPGFLYLGPEPAEEAHVEEMKSLGIRRILNIAFECNPTDHGLDLQATFEKYIKIPMRDTVEEDRVRDGIKTACDALDDARLHSAPVYVHCKAGKSRSVTAVIAYLIHANHWTLSRAYSFVLERRKGISPNIGFVSELMNFEERELGGKSVGVQKSAGAQPNESTPSATVAHPHRRGAHVRESLPPLFVHSNSQGDGVQGSVSAIDAAQLKLMGLGEEMEMRDSGGRYRHARRAPVDEQTLQPMRRVSKAGLESIGIIGLVSDDSKRT